MYGSQQTPTARRWTWKDAYITPSSYNTLVRYNTIMGPFKNAYELVNLGAFETSLLNKLYIFQCRAKIFCVEFQMVSLKFDTKYITHRLKDMVLIQFWKFKSSRIYELVRIFETPPVQSISTSTCPRGRDVSLFLQSVLHLISWNIKACYSWYNVDNFYTKSKRISNLCQNPGLQGYRRVVPSKRNSSCNHKCAST